MHGISYRSQKDYIRFQVVLRVPIDAKDVAFEGMTTTMSLRVKGDKHHSVYSSFDYTTRNSHIDFAVCPRCVGTKAPSWLILGHFRLQTLEAKTVKLTTTNAHISMLEDASGLTPQVGLRAESAALTTTNGKVDLSIALVEVGDLLTIKSTSGPVLGWAGELQPFKDNVLDKLVIETTNGTLASRTLLLQDTMVSIADLMLNTTKRASRGNGQPRKSRLKQPTA